MFSEWIQSFLIQANGGRERMRDRWCSNTEYTFQYYFLRSKWTKLTNAISISCGFVVQQIIKLEGAQRVHISAKRFLHLLYSFEGRKWVAWGRWLMRCLRDTYCWILDLVRTDTHTDRQEVKTVYPPVSLRSLVGYNKCTTNPQQVEVGLMGCIKPSDHVK